MNSNDLKGIAEGLIDEFNYAAKETIRLYEEGLKIQIKEDKSPCLLYTSPSPRDMRRSRMPSSA